MYNKDNFDHIFYRMKQSIPKSHSLFMFISVLKVYPLFLLCHSGGYTVPKENLSKLHTYFKFFTVSFYLHNSLSAKNILILFFLILVINLILIIGLIYYLYISKKIKQIDDNYTDINSLGYLFFIFSHFVFFKYLVMFQFFMEMNFFPLACINNIVDEEKIIENKIFTKSEKIKSKVENLCNGSNLYIFLIICILNFLIDVFYSFLISSRFFDFNILSDYNWNFYPSYLFNFEYLESYSQIFFNMFLLFDNKKYKLIFDIYILVLLLLTIIQDLKGNTFYTSNNATFIEIARFVKIMSFISSFFIAIFLFSYDKYPNDMDMVGLIIVEVILTIGCMFAFHKNEENYIKKILVDHFSLLNEKNIYPALTFLIKEFKVFSDVNVKFSDKNLDLFLFSYVDHLKSCEDSRCPCKNYVKKVNGATNTIKSGYTTLINLTHMKKDQTEEYILNKFFNVLAANINSTIKDTNNVNLNNIKDSEKQKLTYKLRTKLITAVKKLLSYRLEKITKKLDTELNENFSSITKDFIRINFYSVNILCNKSYYKTQFLYYEYLSDYFKKYGLSYKFNLIYYYYLKNFAIKEYNAQHVNNRNIKEHRGSHLDFRTILNLCVKYYEIEDKLMSSTNNFEEFIIYFTQNNDISFNELLGIIKKFKNNYKSVTQYISHYFKNDKINNLFVCTKIILFFKILNFDIPETLHNKLIIQVHDTDENNKHSNLDSNYYIIINYINDEFIIKFISHELLIVLEYSEDELKNQDFHILMPQKLRKLHKTLIINGLKGKNSINGNKEIFFVAKKRNCVLFDIQYRFLLNLRGEITLLTVVNLKKPNKDFRMCFCCIDQHGEILALNKEFEDYFILNMNILDVVKLDTEKIILQNMGNRMRNFFKDEENTEFIEQFDYELYLQSLFDENFEVLKEKNEREYKRKIARWEILKEMNRKGRYYTRYIELNIKQRTLGHENIYFLKYNVKITLNLKNIEPHSTTLSLIHAVKVSKREMAKLSFYKGEDMYESSSHTNNSLNNNTMKTDKGLININEENINESKDDLFESQSQISSAASQLKERNTVRLFNKQKKESLIYVPKSKNIYILMIIITILSIISVAYDIISLILKIKYYDKLEQFLAVNVDILILKKNIIFLSQSSLILIFIEEGILTNSNLSSLNSFVMECNELIYGESSIMDIATYNISYINSKYYDPEIDKILSQSSNTLNLIFNNGFIYNREDSSIFQEIIKIKKTSLDILIKYEINSTSYNFPLVELNKSNIYNYYFLNIINEKQKEFNSSEISLSEQDINVFFLLTNLMPEINNYINNLIRKFNEKLNKNQTKTKWLTLLFKLIEFILLIIIIIIEWIFIFLGYGKSKKKLFQLKKVIENNNIEITLQKIEEFLNFSNNFRLGSLYYIADLDYKKIKNIMEPVPSINYNSPITNQSILSNSTKKTNFNINSNTNEMDSLNVNSLINNNIKSNSTHSLIKTNYLYTDENKNLTIHNGITPGNFETDGKKNLLKVMHKLDQIKGIKKNITVGVKKEGTNESKKSYESNNNEISNNNINDVSSNNMLNTENSNLNKNNNNKDNINQIYQHSNSLNTNGEPTKGNLRTVNSLNQNNFKDERLVNIQNNIELSNERGNDESKINILKNDDGIGLLSNENNNKKKREPKVRFVVKNVRFYSPNQNVDKSDKTNMNNDENKEVDNNLINNIDLVEYQSSLESNINNKKYSFPKNSSTKNNHYIEKINNNEKNNPTNNQINDNSKSKQFDNKINKTSSNKKLPNFQNGMIGNNFNNSTSNLNTPIGINEKENTDNYVQNNKLQLIDKRKFVTTKKAQTPFNNNKDDDKNEEVTEEIKQNKINLNNLFTKVMLNITLMIFILLYSFSLYMNFKYDSNVQNAKKYVQLLFNKTTLIIENIINYQFHIIRNFHDEDSNNTDKELMSLSKILSQNEKSIEDLIKFETNENPKVLKQTYNFEMNLRDNDFCKYFTNQYSILFGNNYEEEYNECLIIGNKMNINGIENSITYILSTMISFFEDWNNLYKKKDQFSKNDVISKLNDEKFYGILELLVFTFRKYSQLLGNFIVIDEIEIFDNIKLIEEIFGIVSILLNITFLILSLIFIIYPIKSVDGLISWLSNKILKI